MPRRKRLPRLMVPLLGMLALLAALVFWPDHRALGLSGSPASAAAPYEPGPAGQPGSPLPVGHDRLAALAPVTPNISVASVFSRPDPGSSPEQPFPDKIATPGTLLLFASGLFGLAICRRRKTPDKPQPEPRG